MVGIKITINGHQIEVTAGTYLIHAARESGFYIPGICHHPDLKPDAVCGLCVVEIEGFDTPQLSCTVRCESGMVIKTISSEIEQIRNVALAQILANHPHGCLDCELRFSCDRTDCAFGKPEYDRCCGHFDECELRHLVDYLGVPENTPPYTPRELPELIEKEIMYRNYELCIECTRCQRACIIAEGLDIYRNYFVNGKLVQSSIKPLAETDCSFCGYCVDACPTGAISLLETDFGFAGYFPMGTSGRLRIPTPPPSEKMPFTPDRISNITVNPGRFNIYNKEDILTVSERTTNLNGALLSIIKNYPDHYFTIQPDY